MDPIAYRFAVTQHDGMRLTYEGTTSVACKLNIWEGTELVPPHLHTPHRSNVSVTALAPSDMRVKILSKTVLIVAMRHLPDPRAMFSVRLLAQRLTESACVA